MQQQILERINKKTNSGFVGLISVLVVGALILTIAIGSSLRSIGETNMAFGEQEGNRALAMAEMCAEYGLMRLESLFNYSGNESLNVDGETCYIGTVTGSGNFNRSLTASSTVSNYVKTVEVVVYRISPNMEITSWQDI
ncbi:hypothetical protein ACFLY7_01735 [Patescibacteria group bacterium]